MYHQPSSDAALTNQIRRKRYHNIVTNKETGLGGETLFEFKHIPKLTRTTRLGRRRASTPSKYGIEDLARIGLFGAVGAIGVICSLIVLMVQFVDLKQVFLRIENEIARPGSLSKFTLFG